MKLFEQLAASCHAPTNPENGVLNLVTVPFESFKRLNESAVPLPKKKVGPPCIGFYNTINGTKVKINCPFGIKSRTKDNAYWNKQQWSLCLGCKILYNNLVYNPGKLEEHRKIKARAAKADDDEEKRRIMLESSIFAHNQANRFRRTFDVEEALKDKARTLIRHKEWSSKGFQDVSYSLVLRVLRNGSFIHLRTQADVDVIRKPLTKAEQADHLEWIKANTHHGFRTGAELILLTEAGMNMLSIDRSDSNKKIDEIGQTIVADSWGFNRLSNSLSERATDRLLREILAGDYADGDAAFERRNGDGEPGRLSEAWE
ncbi:hypothetical protein HDU77_001503, partial [Chytriomyces hyalinus]